MKFCHQYFIPFSFLFFSFLIFPAILVLKNNYIQFVSSLTLIYSFTKRIFFSLKDISLFFCQINQTILSRNKVYILLYILLKQILFYKLLVQLLVISNIFLIVLNNQKHISLFNILRIYIYIYSGIVRNFLTSAHNERFNLVQFCSGLNIDPIFVSYM